MIDLGDELDGYSDGDEPARPARPGQPMPTPAPGGGHTIPLADLQAAGFNMSGAVVRAGGGGSGDLTGKIIRGSKLLNALLNDEPPPNAGDDDSPPGPLPPIVHIRTWLPGDDPRLQPFLDPNKPYPPAGDEDDDHA